MAARISGRTYGVLIGHHAKMFGPRRNISRQIDGEWLSVVGNRHDLHIRRNPDDLAVIVIARSQNVSDVHRLAALVLQFAAQNLSSKRVGVRR
jgi:hypothetical protein